MRNFTLDPCPDTGLLTAPTPETRAWIVFEVLRGGYGPSLFDLIDRYGLSLTELYDYELRWRREMDYYGPSLLP